MALDLHPDLSPLPPWKRAVYALCLVVGITGLALFGFAVLVETLTAPGARGHAAWRTLWVLLPIAYALWHVTREVPAWGPISGPARRGRWALFLASAGSLAFQAWTLIADPTAALFFAGAGLASAALIAAARLIARDAGPPRNEDGA